jgi:virulence-associated protein VapD
MNFIEFTVTFHGTQGSIYINSESIVYFHSNAKNKEQTIVGLSNEGPYTLEHTIEDVKTKLGIVPKKKAGF